LTYLVGDDDDAGRVGANVIDKDFSFGVAKFPVDVSNVERRVLHEGHCVDRTHWDDDMLPRRFFTG